MLVTFLSGFENRNRFARSKPLAGPGMAVTFSSGGVFVSLQAAKGKLSATATASLAQVFLRVIRHPSSLTRVESQLERPSAGEEGSHRCNLASVMEFLRSRKLDKSGYGRSGMTPGSCQ